MMTMAVPVTAEENVREQNRAYILDLVGDAYDAEAMIEAPNGEMVEGEEALEMILDRLDAFDANLAVLDDVEKNPVTGTPTAGDLFLIELAFGFCNQHGFGVGGHYNNAEASPAAYAAPDPFNPFGGITLDFIGDATSIGSSGVIFDFVTGSAYGFGSQVDYAGSSDFWCLGFFGIAFNLPYVQGVVA
jgi:hypothetical protein